MGLIQTIAGPIQAWSSTASTFQVVAVSIIAFLSLVVFLNVAQQILFKNPNEPPIVFHLFPVIGSTITYGIDPYKFFFGCREKYGDIFTFILLGKKTTVFLGTKGSEFILNGKLRDLNAEEIYSPLTTPVFGTDVVYDCPNSKLMEQKKFVKFGLTTSAFQSYVPLITNEVQQFFSKDAQHKRFAGQSGTVDLPHVMAELTIYTASRSLQGKEVRERFDSTFADLYHDLDMGFTPVNFMLPWAPLPQNRKRDYAQRKMAETYMSIIKERKAQGGEKQEGREEDMIWNLMNCQYKGEDKPVPDKEVAHMMIALLMAGQHSSSSTITWIFLRLASRPDIQEELLAEQKSVLGAGKDGELPEMTYEDLSKLPLHSQVIKETLRLHAPIHSILRKVTQPMVVQDTPYTIPTTHTLLAAPGFASQQSEHFPEPAVWEPHRWDEEPSEKHAALAPKHVKEGVVEEKEDYGYGLISKGAASPYLPFGAGRHRCIGEQFAYVQLGTIMAELVREFKFKNPEGKEDIIVGTDYSSLFSRPLSPAVIRWERRGEKA